MRSPVRKDHYVQGIYQEIVEPERIVFTHAWEVLRANPAMNAGGVRFLEHGGKTKLSFHQGIFESIANRDSHGKGWNECFDKLAAALAIVGCIQFQHPLPAYCR